MFQFDFHLNYQIELNLILLKMIQNEEINYLNVDENHIELIEDNEQHKYGINNDIINELFYVLIEKMLMEI